MSYQQDHKLNVSCLRAQRGMVVLMALFIVAIIAAMSYAMLSRLARDTYRTEMILNDAQLSNDVRGSVAWAADYLQANLLKKTPDARVDAMPVVSPLDETQGRRVVTRIEDMQARYNINRLADPKTANENQAAFIRLVRALNIKIEKKQLDLLIEAIKDWLMPSTGLPELNKYYAALPIPYRAGHQLMAHISELRLVKGVTPQLYQQLLPYVVALPATDTRINLFTASPFVLTTLSAQVTLEQAAAIAKAVATLQTSDANRLQTLPIMSNLALNSEQFTVVSDYFLVTTSVSMESQQLVVYTLLERKVADATNPQKSHIKIIWQSKGIA